MAVAGTQAICCTVVKTQKVFKVAGNGQRVPKAVWLGQRLAMFVPSEILLKLQRNRLRDRTNLPNRTTKWVVVADCPRERWKGSVTGRNHLGGPPKRASLRFMVARTSDNDTRTSDLQKCHPDIQSALCVTQTSGLP